MLLRASDQTEHISEADDSTLAKALASAKILGAEVSLAAARFLTWRFSSLIYNYNSTHLPWHVGLLVLAVRLRANRFTDAELTEITEWVLDNEAAYLRNHPVHVADPRPTIFSVESGFWTPLVVELKSAADSAAAEELRTNLHLCAMMMEE